MHSGFRTAIFIGAVLLGLSGCYAPQSVSVMPSYDGAMLYREHCASCHGKEGAGNGPLIVQMRVAPQDLRTLSERNDGRFPRLQLVRQIDGRDLRAVHGSRDMPVWGWHFSRADSDYRDAAELVDARIEALVDHIESIQVSSGR
jgi:hypothetical protein